VRLRAALAGALLTALAAIAPAAADGTAGDFDFYVLSLSWSATYCKTDSHPDPTQCRRDFGFVVHGLWPQYERGYPDSCPTNMPLRVRDETVASIADLMPGAGLVNHEWRKHGVCTGLNQENYFKTVRAAYQRVKIPPALADAFDRDRRISPRELETAFIAFNPRMVETGIAVTCERNMLEEVRICLTKSLEFRRCPEVDRQSCRLSTIVIPGR
jgi:ribonuclease T2